LEHYKALIASRNSNNAEILRNKLLQNLKIVRQKYNNLPAKPDEGVEVEKVDVNEDGLM
jgi:hypothetical protein